MASSRRTFLVECYGPDIDAGSVAAAGARARAACDRLERVGVDAHYLGAVLVAEDDVVFHAFAGADAAGIEVVCREAGLVHERVVESIAVTTDGSDPDPAAILAGIRSAS
ncbi:MAG TPA: hypothetical protein VIZ22_05650 [Candidatus Limnocylindrales bacterium]